MQSFSKVLVIVLNDDRQFALHFSGVTRRQDNRRAGMRRGREEEKNQEKVQEEEKEKSGSTRSRQGDKDKEGPDAKKKK